MEYAELRINEREFDAVEPGPCHPGGAHQYELDAADRVIRWTVCEENDALRNSMASRQQRLPFDRLSDGYRNLVAMVADIAWRAIQLNPHHGADALERSNGVVLIDEIELHLHPRWQRTVQPGLMRIFPNIQFVVTTHSPVIISSVAAEIG